MDSLEDEEYIGNINLSTVYSLCNMFDLFN
jgi:hypothetical protein